MNYFNYAEQFYHIYIYMKHSMGFLGKSVEIFFLCVAKEALKSKSQRAESKLIS